MCLHQWRPRSHPCQAISLPLSFTLSISKVNLQKQFLSGLNSFCPLGSCYSVALLCPTLCNPRGLQHARLPCPSPSPDVAEVHVHCICDAIQTSHPLMPSSPFALNLSQRNHFSMSHLGLHQMTKILELQLQHQSFQWVFGIDFLQDWLAWSLCCPRGQESSPAQFEGISSLVFSQGSYLSRNEQLGEWLVYKGKRECHGMVREWMGKRDMNQSRRLGTGIRLCSRCSQSWIHLNHLQSFINWCILTLLPVKFKMNCFGVRR